MHSPRRQRLIPRRAARPPKAPLVNSTSIFHYSLEMWLLEAHPSFNYALVQSYHTRVIKFLRSELLLIFCAIPRGCPGRAWKATRQPRACRVRALPGAGAAAVPGCPGAGGSSAGGVTPALGHCPFPTAVAAGPVLHDLGSAGNLFLGLVYSFIRCWFNRASSPPSPLILSASVFGTSVPRIITCLADLSLHQM